MFLKSLDIRGFKSFADRAELAFEPGVTVVVGPNGSGKSNVVDAVTWVLGAQGARALRGAKMEDVIFAGSRQRSPLGRAQVLLTIDNSTGILPVDFAEVTLSRTLYRTGESEYSINGAPCRLLDIQELLSDTGVGRQFHTIVGQGQIDTILSARPEDRRAVIEEAAGILKYRRRKEKALRRLASTEGNLLRLQDLTRELGRQLKPLERQADAARRRDEVESRLKAIKWWLAGSEHKAIHGQRVALAARLEDARSEREAATTRIKSAEAEQSALETQLIQLQTGGNQMIQLRNRIESAIDQLIALADLADEKRRVFEARATAPEVLTLDILESEASKARARLSELDAELEPLKERLEAARLAERDIASERATLRERLGDFDGDVGRRVAELTGERSGLEAAVTRAEVEAGRLFERKQTNQKRLDRAREEKERLTAEIERLDSEATPLASEVERVKRQRESVRAEVRTLEDERRAIESEASMWAGRLEALRMAAEQAQVEEGARRLLDSDSPGLIGIVSELIEVDSGLEAAAEAALGEALDALVVSTSDAVDIAVAKLKDESGGVARFYLAGADFVGASPVADLPSAGEADPLVAHVRAAAGNAAVNALLRNLLARIYLAPSWRAAWELSRRYEEAVFVTADGDRLHGKGAWKGGAGSRGILQQTASLAEVAENARRAERRLDEATKNLDRRREELERLVSETESLESALHENDALLTAAAGRLASIDPEIEDLASEAESLAEAEAELASRLSRDRDRLAEIDRILTEGTGEDGEALKAEGELRKRLQEVEKGYQDRVAERLDAEVAVAQTAERRGVIASRLAEVEADLAAEQAAKPRRAAERSKARSAAGATERIAERARAAASRATASFADLLARVRPGESDPEGMSSKLESLRSELATLRQRVSELDDEIRNIEIEDAGLRVRLDQLEVEIRYHFSCEPEEAHGAELPEGISEGEAAGEAGALERDLARMGPVNPLALKEHEELSERIEFVKGQLEDLKASRRELQKIVRAVDKAVVEIFETAYNEVALHFSDIFGRLFPGGAGKLSLTDPSDMLTTGVEISARPSGKNVRKLSLLSGGERSLAALAFLFAVFRARPSPFYLLDEVEAALDDVNLNRFLDLVNEFRAEAQLVIITHQKRTMEVADCLYGVTMQSSGVSKVVSQKMTDSISV